MTIERDILLRGFAGGLFEALALGDEDLRTHDVDAGDLFGDRVFHLHTRVHFDEVELARVHIHEEFDGARAFIVHMGTDFAAQLTNLCALFVGEVWGRGAFNHFLVAALHRTIAFIKVVDIALLVAQDLNLDVTGAGDHFLEIALAIAKSGFGFAAALFDLFFELFGIFNRAHAASAAAPRGFEHERETDLRSFRADRVEIVTQNLGCRDHRYICRDGHFTGGGFVPKRAHGGRFRADKSDARRVTGVNEFRVFGQKPITGMDRIRAAGFRHADDFLNRQIGRHGPHAFANLIGFVRFETVQGQLVLFGIDRNGPFPHFVCRPHHTNSNFAAVGD